MGSTESCHYCRPTPQTPYGFPHSISTWISIMIWLTNDTLHSIFLCLIGSEYDPWIRINGDPLLLSYFSLGHRLTRITDDFLHNSMTPTTRNWIMCRIRSIARVITAYRTTTGRANIMQHRTLLAYLHTHLSNTTRTPPIPWPIPTGIV